MSWHVAYMSLNHAIPASELQTALGQIYGVDANQVLIKHDPESVWAENLDQMLVVCQARIIPGDFPLYIEITLLKRDLSAADEQTIAGLVCAALNCQAILSSNFRNPYSCILVSGPNQYQNVEMDDNILDGGDWGFVIKVYDSAYTEDESN
ncbi:MAG: hypothetical protein F9K46_02910 [Anaerolineae bacterium]|nr:MAG: hypothetical protein F9K46_02910 [Anaerolineae bacterium]